MDGWTDERMDNVKTVYRGSTPRVGVMITASTYISFFITKLFSKI